MSNGSANVLRKPVTRAGFFRWGADTARRLGTELIGSKLDQFKNGSPSDWSKLTDENTVGLRPRMHFTKGTPFFVLNDEAKGTIVFSASCPEEGGLLEWRENLKSFCCPFCQSKYNREGKSQTSSTISLVSPEIQLIEGQVMVKAISNAKITD